MAGPLARELFLGPGPDGVRVPLRQVPDATATLVCGFCSTGCGLKAHLREQLPVNLVPDPAYPVNRGAACPKGWEALTPLAAPDRATTPLLRDARGHLVPIDWSTAAATFARRVRAVQAKHGPASVAFLSSGQIVSEEMALLGVLAKHAMGLVHGDGNTRQCMASAVTAYKEAFGFDAPPYSYADLEASDVVVLVGSNLCIAHPILWQRLLRNPHRPTVIVLDPRRTETAAAATLHLALRPRSDHALFLGLGHLFAARGWLDEGFLAHTRGWDDYRAHLAGFPPERVCDATGLAPAELERLAAAIHGGRRVSFWWTMGVNQSHEGVRTAQAIINLALMTGNLGRPGTGANSITGQCNAMGSRLFSNTTSLLGGRDFRDAGHRAEVARILGHDAAAIPAEPGLAYDQIVEGIAAGRIRGLWVIATNPAHSWVNLGDLHELLGRLDFLCVQDMYTTTETARRAHLVLPAAGWGEKEGTFINSERRIGVVRKVARAPGQALADFQIFRLLGEAWGAGRMLARWSSPEAAFGILRELSRGTPCDFSGIADYAALEAAGGIQWPCPEATPPDPERRLFAERRFFHADGRARFCWDPPRPMPEPPSARYPFLMLSGRGSAAQWHTQTRTGKSSVLAGLHPAEPWLELSPADARRLGVGPHQWLEVRSRRGAMKARAAVSHVVRPGQVFVPMHYPDVNRLTLSAFDPFSRQPAYKAVAVALTPLGSDGRPIEKPRP
jgi:assimilatory nitrate reductase catalytic subunit